MIALAIALTSFDPVETNNRLGFRLLSEVQQTTNPMVSPYSLNVALGMMMVGAGGRTRSELAKVLGVEESSAGQYLDSFPEIRKRFVPGDAVWKEANAVWAVHRLKVRDSFKKDVQGKFEADVEYVDPLKPQVINEWVRRKTDGAVGRLVGTLPADTTFFFANALCFRGRWQKPFDLKKTEPGQFEVWPPSPGSGIVSYMRSEIETFRSHDGVETATLPYKGGKLEMVLVKFPRGDFESWFSQLTPAKFDDLFQGRTRKVQAWIPRWKSENHHDLSAPLQRMGLVEAFTSKADFSNFAEPNSRLLGAVQATSIDVEESGTVAAAATGFGGGFGGSEPTEFRLDRPFLYAIRERATGLILFLGRFDRPAAPSKGSS